MLLLAEKLSRYHYTLGKVNSASLALRNAFALLSLNPITVQRSGQRVQGGGRGVRPSRVLHRPVRGLPRGQFRDEWEALLQSGPGLLPRRPMPHTQPPLLEAVRTRYPQTLMPLNKMPSSLSLIVGLLLPVIYLERSPRRGVFRSKITDKLIVWSHDF